MKVRELKDALFEYDPDMEVGVVMEAPTGTVFLPLGALEVIMTSSMETKLDLEFSSENYEEI